MTTIKILPWNHCSNGARQLALELGTGKVKPKAVLSSWLESVPPVEKIAIINWGSGSSTNYINTRAHVFLNPTSVTNLCSNKLKFFNKLKGTVRIPEFTDDLDIALDWGRSGHEVMGREVKGSCGTDIVFYSDDPVGFATRQFWVKYKKKKFEFRVHVMDNKVLFVQKKVLRSTDVNGEPLSPDNVDFRIRNHRNGFIFQRNDFTVPADVSAQALLAIKNVGADFGAVDVIYNQLEDKAYVLEINTAPGLEGSSVTEYAAGFRKLISDRLQA